MSDILKSEENADSSTEKIKSLTVDNLLLSQEIKFQSQFKNFIEGVEKQIAKGNVKLGLLGLIVLGVAWLGTYQKVEEKVQERLDKEFGSQQIQTMISQSADKAAREKVNKNFADLTDKENNRLRCLVDRQGRQLFVLQCRFAGGQPDDMRGVCVEASGGEKSYDPAFPKIDCESILDSNVAESSSPHG